MPSLSSPLLRSSSSSIALTLYILQYVKLQLHDLDIAHIADRLRVRHTTMWLLSTDRAELYSFARNLDAVGGYAILSHTWDGNEQSFVDVRAIGERCRANGTNPRDDLKLCTKIREFCILAAERGYRWAWVDSCCIDKTSSSELSEAVNSM